MLIHASPGYNMGLGEGKDGGGTEEVLGEERETELGVYLGEWRGICGEKGG